MNYLKKSFTVPVQPEGVSQEEWDRIFKKCPRCGQPWKDLESCPGACGHCGAMFCCADDESQGEICHERAN